MTVRLTAMSAGQAADLAWAMRNAPGPAPVPCAGCGDDLHGSYGVGFRPFCRDCVDRDEWLSGRNVAFQESPE